MKGTTAGERTVQSLGWVGRRGMSFSQGLSEHFNLRLSCGEAGRLVSPKTRLVLTEVGGVTG